MPGIEGMPPTAEELVQLRKKALARLTASGTDFCLPADINKLRESDKYVTRFWQHVWDEAGSQMDNAEDMIIKSFRWRKEFGVDEISLEKLDHTFLDQRTIYADNHRDKEGHKLLIIAVRKHTKNSELMEDTKKCFVYFLEQLLKEEREAEKEEEAGEVDKEDGYITLLFDCSSAGLKNLDLEFMQFVIGTLKDFYPLILNHILVLEMPWVLSAAWMIIKAWLPAAARNKIKFVNKAQIKEYIDDPSILQ